MSLGEREDELLDTLEAVIDAELPYVLVGGWAVAAFKQRFTTDVDAVIPAQALDNYAELLGNRGYEKIADVERNERCQLPPTEVVGLSPRWGVCPRRRWRRR